MGTISIEHYDDALWKKNETLGITYNPWWELDRDEDHRKLDREEIVYHLGVDDGLTFGELNQHRLAKENASLRGLLDANVRVIKAELARELGYGDQLPKRNAEGGEGGTEEPTGPGGPDGSGTESPSEQQQGRGLRSVQAHSVASQDAEQEDQTQQASVAPGQVGSH